MRLLLTAFDPFGGEAVNPALEAVKMVRPVVSSVEVVKLEVPTVFGKAIQRVAEAIAEIRPDAVLCIGQAGGRFDISVERVAINIDDARIADNEGNQPIDRRIADDGPPAYFSTLPIKAMVDAIRKLGLPGSVSNTAGTFVCNHVFYGLMHRLATARGLKHTRGGFIHVPMLPEQGDPSLPLAQMVEGLRIGIRTALAVREDVRLGGGAVD